MKNKTRAYLAALACASAIFATSGPASAATKHCWFVSYAYRNIESQAEIGQTSATASSDSGFAAMQVMRSGEKSDKAPTWPELMMIIKSQALKSGLITATGTAVPIGMGPISCEENKGQN